MPRPPATWKTERVCKSCQQAFIPSKPTSECCSRACAREAQKLKPNTPCVRCGCTERNAKKACVACTAKQQATYRAKNLEERLEATRLWRANNHEKVLNYAKRYRADGRVDKEYQRRYNAMYNKVNAQALSDYRRAYYQANKKRLDALSKEWTAANRALHNTYVRRWMSGNAERLKTYKTRRRTGVFIEHLEPGLFSRLMKSQDGKCPCCGEALSDYHLDHKTPLSRGGTHHASNLQLMRPICNLRKGAKTFEEYMEWKQSNDQAAYG